MNFFPLGVEIEAEGEITKHVIAKNICLLFVLYQEASDEVLCVVGDLGEGFVIKIVLRDRHIGHRLYVRVAHKW